MALAFLIAGGMVVWMWESAARRHATEEAVFLDLDALFTASDALPCGGLGDEFSLLLKSNSGQDLVRRLAAEHEAIVFYEPRNAVYYAHERRSGSYHRSEIGWSDPSKRAVKWKSCIGTVWNKDQDKLSGHCGLTHQLAVEALNLEGDVLKVRCKTTTEEADLFYLTNIGFSPGTLYEARVDLSRDASRYLGRGDLDVERFHPVDG